MSKQELENFEKTTISIRRPFDSALAGGPIMEDILTDAEKWFLAHYGLAPDDVYDARGQPGRFWKERIREENKTIALGTRCGNGGHRLRTRAGHCVQCDPKKLAFEARHSAEQYVYIAGSVSEKLIKIGTCKNVPQRERQVRAERYGGVGDWNVIFSVKVRNAGDVEHQARSKLCRHIVVRSYWKDGFEQRGIELLQCSFTRAWEALMEAAETYQVRDPWKAPFTFQYEFDDA
jgi:hypothetical protein